MVIKFSSTLPGHTMPLSTKASLLSAIDDDRPRLVAFLQTLIRAPSPNPPGDTTAAAAVVISYLQSHGIHTDTITAPNKPHLPNVVTVLNEDGTGACLVMNPHLDVFPVSDGNEWTHGPWSGDVVSGRIYGRGVVDMKAGTAAQVIAFAFLSRHIAPEYVGTATPNSKRRIALACVSDEETGGKFGSVHLLDNDPRRETWLGDVVLNAEPVALSSIRFAEKGTLRLTFTIKAQSAHGAYTHLSEGAIRIAARLIARLVKLEDFDGFEIDPAVGELLKRQDVRDRADEIMGAGAAASITRPTVNIGTISGGNKVNTIPGLCSFEADVRLPCGLTAAVLMKEINIIIADFPSASVEVQEAASNPPNWNAPDHALVRAVQRNAEGVLGKEAKKVLALPSLG
jgi:succinyl-diaminopimelate desuccinylase